MSLRQLPTELASLMSRDQLPSLGPEIRAGVQAETQIRDAVRQWSVKQQLPGESSELIQCVALLWHDHLEAAHQIAQSIGTPDGSWLHGIMHRREPDYWNAKYWFRRAGQHPAYATLADQAGPLLDQGGQPDLAERLVKSGSWDPFAFVDAVEEALGPEGNDRIRECLQQVQAVELEAAARYFLG